MHVEPVNDPPVAFTLLLPSDSAGLEFPIDSVEFSWEAANGPDEETIVYRLWITDAIDTVFSIELTETTFRLFPDTLLQIFADYDWSVHARDAEFAVASMDTFQFSLLGAGPQVVRPIPTQVVDENSSAYIVADLDTVFFDEDSPELTYSVSTDENINAFVDENILVLHPAADFTGTSEVVVTASDEQPLYANHPFLVHVEPTTDIGEHQILPTEFALNQNYPNPFNPSTTISYQLPVSGYIELSIYNVNGQKARQLVSEFAHAGRHDVVWDGTDDAGKPVASGLYVYRLATNGRTGIGLKQTRKMVLVH